MCDYFLGYVVLSPSAAFGSPLFVGLKSSSTNDTLDLDFFSTVTITFLHSLALVGRFIDIFALYFDTSDNSYDREGSQTTLGLLLSQCLGVQWILGHRPPTLDVSRCVSISGSDLGKWHLVGWIPDFALGSGLGVSKKKRHRSVPLFGEKRHLDGWIQDFALGSGLGVAKKNHVPMFTYV